MTTDQSADAVNNWIEVRRLVRKADAALKEAVAEHHLQGLLYPAASDDDGEFTQRSIYDEVDDRNQDDVDRRAQATMLRLLRASRR